jgi:hypothetical protein
MEEDFYATLKLRTGEEIFARVTPTEENEKTLLLVVSPIIVNEIKSRSGATAYKIEPWLKTTTEDMFIINMNDIITISESSDIEIISLYQTFISKTKTRNKSNAAISRKMGYISNVREAKRLLKKLYDNS